MAVNQFKNKESEEKKPAKSTGGDSTKSKKNKISNFFHSIFYNEKLAQGVGLTLLV
ncbi:MAG: hypothetical protein GW818_06520, partial [Flavobacteriales bacterium]|nr:hypothetical protein [Flavobacteriales bacterium]